MTAQSGEGRRSATVAFVVAGLVLAVLWASFSEKFDALHIGYGVFSVGLTLWLSRTLLYAPNQPWESDWPARVRWRALLIYPFWLQWEIIKANIDVAKLVLGPQDRIDPALLRFETTLTGPLAIVALANSITLTPGTYTIDVDGRTLRVHAITADAATGPTIAQMEELIAAALGIEPVPPAVPAVVTRSIDDPRFTEERA